MRDIAKKVYPYAWFVAVALVFNLTCRFTYYSTETFGHDAGIFAYIGYGITQGVPPYVGAWDNKGPLLYFINALGVLINYRYGIAVLEFISLFISQVFLYKTAKLFTDKFTAIILTLFCMMQLTYTLEGGNLSEEWAMPFTSVGFYLICKYLSDSSSLEKYEMVLVGVCIAAVFLLRLNILIFLATAVCGVVLVLLRKKDYKALGNAAGFAFVGFMVTLVPFIIYLAIHGALKDCIDAAYLGAISAFSDIPKIEAINNVVTMCTSMIPSGGAIIVIAFMIVAPIYVLRNKDKEGDAAFLSICYIGWIGVILNLLGNSLSGAAHMHYFMSFVPIIVVPCIFFARLTHGIIERVGLDSDVQAVVVLLVAMMLVAPSINNLKNVMFSNLKNGTEAYKETEAFMLREYIVENSKPDDKIIAYGGGAAASSYYATKRLAASNYFYYANGRFSDSMKEAFAEKIVNDIQENKPAIIVFSTQKWEDFCEHLSDPESFMDMLQSEYQNVDIGFGDYKAYTLKAE